MIQKLVHREAKQHIRCHTASQYQSQDPYPGDLAPDPLLSTVNVCSSKELNKCLPDEMSKKKKSTILAQFSQK